MSLLSKALQNKFLDKLEETNRQETLKKNNGISTEDEIPNEKGSKLS